MAGNVWSAFFGQLEPTLGGRIRFDFQRVQLLGQFGKTDVVVATGVNLGPKRSLLRFQRVDARLQRLELALLFLGEASRAGRRRHRPPR